ncbi:MAG: HlyC/CorC family transporter [Clostridia bacterium]|nr:HlyC/CorC family transporter [Clostridia bacterium]
MGDGSMIIAIVILVFMSGIFSATETAFSTFNRVRMKNLASDGNKRAELVLRLAEDYDSLITTILIGNNIVNITLASIATVLFVKWYPANGAALSTAVTTVIVLIFGEVSPKSIAKEMPDSFAMTIAPVVRVIRIMFTPLNFLFRIWKKLLAKIFKFKGAAAMTEDELMTIVDEAQQDGGINEQEGELIRSAIGFDDAEVADIITPRVDVVAVDKDTPIEEIEELFHDTGFSRLPVYDDTIDNIVGVLHEKDFTYMTRSGGTDIMPILRKAFFVPCRVKISKLLKQFQQEKAHMAIVLDDYGGTMGVATLEDVIEELVGDIWDEHDEVVELFTKNEDGSVTISGNARPLDMYDYFDVEPEEEDDLPQTVNGWVTMELGRMPEVGEEFDCGNLHVQVTKTDEKMVEEIRVTLIEPAEEPEDGETDENAGDEITEKEENK